ncbi:MAG TPA: Hpt domain-containing protein [Steroidobacteraceae bacterium]|nr:Hpt domain-containing protein [Steroidobacteraceae bacterium]
MSDSRAAREAATTARMNEIAAKFLLRSATDLDAMRKNLVGLANGDATALANIRHFAHRMRGTGATLGFEALSECARRIEQLTDQPLPDAAFAPATLREFAAEFDALAAEMSRNPSAIT